MKRSFALLLGVCLFMFGLAAGVALTKNLLIVEWDVIAPGKLLSAEPALKVPNLQTITAGAVTDEEAFQLVSAYYNAHVSQLATEFKETQPQRLKALYAMYITHISNRYGTPAPIPARFLDYLNQPYSHCGTYSYYQSLILNHLGVPWRAIDISGGTHTFVEASIDGHWEVFDSTVNDWIDTSAFEMERGAKRHARKFYTPMLESDLSDYESYDTIYTAQELRLMMPGLGVFFFPKAVLSVTGASSDQALPPTGLTSGEDAAPL